MYLLFKVCHNTKYMQLLGKYPYISDVEKDEHLVDTGNYTLVDTNDDRCIFHCDFRLDSNYNKELYVLAMPKIKKR